GSGSGARSSRAGTARGVAAIAVALVLANAAPATAASAWSLVPSAVLAKVGQSYLDGVSCAPAAAKAKPTCFAVGSAVTLTGAPRPLVERLVPGSWKARSVPARGHAIASSLVGVSCGSPTSCVAVGTSRATAKSPTVPLIARWGGRKWTLAAVPRPPGASGTY